jgi:protein-S-isoprenylcysteine O-methyltransferase Ste14
MIRFERLFVWLGGALFAASLALAAWWQLVWLARPLRFAGWAEVALDALLFSAFALHHSALARPGVKTRLTRVFPERLHRPIYVWTASLLLAALCVLWRPVGGEVFRHTGLLAFAHSVVQLAGLVLIVLSVRTIDALELAGIRMSKSARLRVAGPFRFVRHPLYLGWMLIVFAPAHMTGDRLVFAAVSSLYLVIAMPWEERSLEETFGDGYRGYKERVRWRVVPFVY